MARTWKVFCMEDDYPGLWRQWYTDQCGAVGWPPEDGFRLRGTTPGGRGWEVVRRALLEIEVGDILVIQLRNHRIGRIGQVTEKKVEDADWNPSVPKSGSVPFGEMGRRILVRWDLSVGPDDKDQVVELPEDTRLSRGEVRGTICSLKSIPLSRLHSAMRNPRNWVGVLGHFGHEVALSDYISVYPHKIEDGLVPYPSKKVRENVFRDSSRSDVLLLDRVGTPVVVECKQGTPTPGDVRQLVKYMKLLRTETGRPTRGILVHGGARTLTGDVRRLVKDEGNILAVCYRLDVDFSSCM